MSTTTQSPPATPEVQTITVRLDIEVKMEGSLANLATVVERSKGLIDQAKQLGTVESFAMVGRQKFPIA